MSEHTSATPTAAERVARGYGGGDVSTVISVEDVVRQVQAIAGDRPTADAPSALARERPFLTIESLRAGYGTMEILPDFDLAVGRGQSSEDRRVGKECVSQCRSRCSRAH